MIEAVEIAIPGEQLPTHRAARPEYVGLDVGEVGQCRTGPGIEPLMIVAILSLPVKLTVLYPMSRSNC